MKTIDTETITKTVAQLCVAANCKLPQDVADALRANHTTEASPVGCEVLEQILKNADIASNETIPICQDTGMAIFFVELGQDVHITGGLLRDAINEGVRQGYTDGCLRKSVVIDPIRRGNTNDNTPAIIHLSLVPGDALTITFAPKGFGSENMSQLRMLKPSDGEDGVKDFIVQCVQDAGSNPCPPIVVGVGIGGTMEQAAIMAKHALTRNLNESHPDSYYADMEAELLARINRLGIGPQGFGGNTTALAVNIETYPTHIAGLPVAVNISCHVTRHMTAVL